MLGCAFSPGGRVVASSSVDSTVRVWDLEEGDLVRTLKGHEGPVWDCAFSPDGSRLVSAGADGTLKVWDPEREDPLRALERHADEVMGCAMTPDGVKVVSASTDTTLKVWKLDTGEPIRTFEGHERWVKPCAVTPDGAAIVSGSADQTLRLWELESGRPLGSPLEGHGNGVLDCAVGPDGSILSSSFDPTLLLWNRETGEVIRRFEGHTARVWGCAVTPDGAHAVSASEDGSLGVWEMSTGEAVARVVLLGPLVCLAIHPSMPLAACGDRAGNLHLGRASGDRVRASAGARSGRGSCGELISAWPSRFLGVSHWAATLMVGAEEGGRLLTPRVCVQGRNGFEGGTLRVELVDESGVVRRVARRPIDARSFGRQLRLPSLKVPGGASADDVVGGPWGIAVESDGEELVRWRRYLAATSSINAEGEIELTGSGDPRRAKEEAEGKGPEAPWSDRDSERLLAVLVDEGEITERDRESALAARVTTGRSIERVLIQKGWVEERELFDTYCELTGTEFIDLAERSIDRDAASLIPAEIALRYGLIAIGYRGDDLLTVAMSDPQHPRAVLDIEAATWRRVYIVVATRRDVLTALEETLRPSRTLAELSA